MKSLLMKLRAGAVDYGRIYEQRIPALLAIKCALDPDIDDFWIISNVDGFGAFDDIILVTMSKDGSKKMFCIQLKHLDRSLQVVRLESDKGDFTLKKYHDSYKEVEGNIGKIDLLQDISVTQIYFILYTNAPLVGTDKTTSINLVPKNGIDFVNTTNKSNSVWQVSSSKKPFDENFLQQFLIYVNQASATDLDKLIKNEFDIHFKDVSNAVIVSVTDYFLKWSVGRKGQIARIGKRDIQTILLESLLQPHIIEPKKGPERDNDIFILLNDTLVNFNLTAVAYDNSLDNIFGSVKYTLEQICGVWLNFGASWNSKLTAEYSRSLNLNDTQKKQQINRVLREKQHFVADLTIKDLYLSAWQCQLIPLIINCNISPNLIQQLLMKFKDIITSLSFVLLNSSNIDNVKENFKVFYNFHSIEDTNLLNRNLERTSVSLQGKHSVQLKQFSTGILSEITPDVYLVLLNGPLQIGETIEMENYYIKRSLKKPHLRLEVLDSTSELGNPLQNLAGNIKSGGSFQVSHIHDVFNYFTQNTPLNITRTNIGSRERMSVQNERRNIFLLIDFNNTFIPVQYIKYIKHTMELKAYLRELASSNITVMEKYILTADDLSPTDGTLSDLATRLHKMINVAVHVVKLHVVDSKALSLEWFFSKGPTENLQPYMIEASSEDDNETLVPEDDMLRYFRSETNIISNNAGMGKTFMLRSLANKFDPNKWICYVNLSEHFSKISKKKLPEVVEYLFGHQINVNDKVVHSFCRKIYINCWTEGNVVWLLDGYDEVPSENILQLMEEIKQAEISMWITTRSTYRRELETCMNTLSLQITHFKEEDHVMFLRKYFETYYDIYGYNEEQIQYIINTINKCSKTLDKTFITIPLQTRMFADIFGDNINEINEKENLTIVDLYNKFVDIKLKEYKSYEATSLKKTLAKLALKLFFTEEQLDELLDFEELAEEALTFQESYRKDSLVIGLDEKGDAVFGHRTFAEFMAGYWLAKQIITKKGQYNTSWVPLIEKLFYVEMLPVRIFFDRILSQDMPLHLAVLNNDMNNIELLLEDKNIKNKLDRLGRSAIHLAVSYGAYYDLYVSEEIQGLKSVQIHTVITESDTNCQLRIPRMNEEQFRVSPEIVEKLLDNGYINIPDYLFQCDAFDYAMKSCSLAALNSLYKRFEKDCLYFEAGYNFKIFLNCIVIENFHNIFSKRKVYDFDVHENRNEIRNMFTGYNSRLLKMKYNDAYLTETAAYSGSKEILYDLLESGVLDIQSGFPVHKACYDGHSDIVEMLFKMGANINAPDVDYWGNPVHQSGRRGRSDVTSHLLKSQKYISISSKNDQSPTAMTPLHYACQGGHIECVKKLIELGASICKEDKFGYTPLMYATLYGNISVVAFLLNTLPKEELQEKDIQSLINVAASKGYSIASLIDCGLNMNNPDEEGETPLILASKNGYPNVIEDLVSKDCDLNFMKTNETIENIQLWAQKNYHSGLFMKLFLVASGKDRKCHGSVSALHYAVRHGHVHCVKKLIELGANADIEDTLPGMGYSPLVWASMFGHDRITKTLLTLKKFENSQRHREDVELAIIWAVFINYNECIKILLEFSQDLDQNVDSSSHQDRIKAILTSEFGVDFNPAVRNFGEITNIPLILAAKNGAANVIEELGSKQYRNNVDLNVGLHLASKSGHVDCVKALVKLGADENVKNERKLRLLPIVWASMYGRTEVVRYFLSNKSKEYLKNQDLHLALNWAALGGHYECVKMLVDFGLDVNNVDQELNENTPLISACEYRGTIEVIDELLSKKCVVNAKNSDGLTALDFAAQKKNYDFVKKLICSDAFENFSIDKDSDLYKNLQLALEWATTKEEDGLLYRLAELGIEVPER